VTIPAGTYARATVPPAAPGEPPRRLIAERVERPDGPYVVRVGESLASYTQTLNRLVATFVLLGPAAAVVSLLGGLWLSRRALAPVDRLTQAALSITATDLHRRVPDDGPRDEVGRLADAFNRMIARLEAAFDETRRFTADAAHELRTPLAVLRTGTEVALRSAKSADDYRAALTDQLEEIDRLSRLADQLLFLCREDAGHAPEPPESVRLDLLLEELCESLQLSAESRGLALHCDELPPCLVAAQPDRLRRLFLNLLDNALSYTPTGGRIDVRLMYAPGQALVTIDDTGPGIPSEHLPHVFDRFYRGDPSRNRATGGSGLGLAICRAIADSLTGDLRLTNRSHGGLTATVRLPAEELPPETPRPERKPVAVAARQ
jgi:heavy metal sensor kinase